MKQIIDKIIKQQDKDKRDLSSDMNITFQRYCELERSDFKLLTATELFDLCSILRISPLIFSEYSFVDVDHQFSSDHLKSQLITNIIKDLTTYSLQALQAASLLCEESLGALNNLVNGFGDIYTQTEEFQDKLFEDDFLDDDEIIA